MKNLNFILVVLISITFSMNVYSQSTSYSQLVKNIHSDGKDLYHDLNASKDSLLYRHDNGEQILRVKLMPHKGKDKGKEFDFGKSAVSVSLDKLGVGRYTVAIYLSNGKVIIHGLIRLLPIPTKEIEKDHQDLRIAKLNTPKKIEVVKRVTKTAPVPKKEEAVAKVAPKPEPVKKVVAKAVPKKKKSTKIITNPSKSKRAVALAKPKKKAPPIPKGPTLADKLRAKAKRNALAAIENKKAEIRQRQFDKEIRNNAPKGLKVTKVSYNLSNADNDTNEKQTREEYRKSNLRPNGKPYDD